MEVFTNFSYEWNGVECMIYQTFIHHLWSRRGYRECDKNISDMTIRFKVTHITAQVQ